MFHDFRMMLYNWGRIDITSYVSLPSAAFDLFLKMSDASIGLIDNPEILAMIQSGIRGLWYLHLVKLNYNESKRGQLQIARIVSKCVKIDVDFL